MILKTVVLLLSWSVWTESRPSLNDLQNLLAGVSPNDFNSIDRKQRFLNDELIDSLTNSYSDYHLVSGDVIESYGYLSSSDSDSSATIPPLKYTEYIIKKYKKCGTRDLCKGKSIQHLQEPLYKTADTWGRNMCFCDDGCSKFGDCCIDKVQQSPPKSDEIMDQESHQWGCIPTGKSLGVRGIVSCNNESEFFNLCSKASYSGVSSDIAVIGKSNSLVYANVFCALCHSLQPKNIVFSKQSILCRSTIKNISELIYSNMTWKKDTKSKTNNLTTNADQCYLQLEGFPPDTRICYSGLERSCPASSTDLAKSCHSYSLPVENTVSTKRYMNPHCALCHGDNIKHLSCVNPFTSRIGSLIALVDFDWDFKRCDWPKNIWDEESNTCQPLDCGSDACVIAKKVVADESDYNVSKFDEEIESYLTVAVLILSIFLLLLHNAIFYSESKRHNVPSHILKNLSWSIIFGHVFFLSVDTKSYVPLYLCKIISLSTQFFYTISFLWMNVMSYDVWRTFSNVSARGSPSSILIKYNIYCCGFSILFILLTFIADKTNILPAIFRPNIGLNRLCWFGDQISLAIYFYIPILFVLFINVFFFGKTVIWFQKQTSKEFEKVNNEATGRKEYRKLWLYIKLSVIMGLTWLFSIAASLAKSQILRYAFIICNGLQGAFLFIMFDMKKATIVKIVSSFRSRTSWTSSSSDLKNIQIKDTTSTTQISRNITAISLKRQTEHKPT